MSTCARTADVAMIRHGVKLKKLSRPADQRKAMLRALTTELIRHGRIKSTLIKCKEVRKTADHMVTLAKDGSLHARAATRVCSRTASAGAITPRWASSSSSECAQ